MHPHAGKIALNGAPSQYDRWLPALDPGYAPVDGRSFQQLLQFSVKYGALVSFYDLRDEVDGDWVGFFLSDPTMILAQLDAVDLAALECEFGALYERTGKAHHYPRKFDLLCALFAFIQGLGRRVNDGLIALARLPNHGVSLLLRRAVTHAVTTSLAPQLRRLKEFAEGAALPTALGQPIPLDWSGFLPLWGLRHDCPDGSIYRGHTRVAKINHALPHLVPIFAAFREAFADLRDFAQANFAASLDEPDHKPQIGLYIAFVELFAKAQATINTLSSRYVDFYYRDMLRETPAGPVGDRVDLTFTLAAGDGVTSATVPAGTAFPAGQDADGRDIIYVSEKTLQVTAAQIDVVHTLRVVSAPLFAMPGKPAGPQPTPTPPRATLRRDAAQPQPLAPQGPPPEAVPVQTPPPVPVVVQRILGSDIALAKAAAKSIPWPAFGYGSAAASAVALTAPATLGFALASPYLTLGGGQRDLEIVVRYTQTFKTNTLDPLLKRIAAEVGLPEDTILRQVLDGAFEVFASTTTGWFATPPYTTDIADPNEPTFTLHLTLQAGAPPIAAFDPEAAAEAAPPADPRAMVNPAPALSTLKLYLRQQPVRLAPPQDVSGTAVDVYPLSLLDGMPVETLHLQTTVADLSDLVLQNTNGPIDPTAPFAVFGAPAVVGSYLEIRKDELFIKRIDKLSFTVDWFDLPANTDGFKGYYRDYKIGLDGRKADDLFDNAVFRGAVAVKNPGPWTIKSDNADLCLFRTQPKCTQTDPAGTLCAATVFDFPATAIGDHATPLYYAPVDAAIRLTLAAPPYAFGDDIFAQNVLAAVIADLPDPAACQQTCETEYAVLAMSAQAIGACLDQCGTQPDDKFRDCITLSLEQCTVQLLLSAAQCLWDCASTAQGKLDAATFGQMKAAFDAASKAAPTERAASFEQWIETWRDKAALDQTCLNKCMFLLDAVIGIGVCLATCASEPAEGYRACVVPGIKACQARLQGAYAKFVEECIAECSKAKPVLNYPNTPWFPSAQRVTVTYKAGAALVGADAEAFFHLLPFGGYQRMATAATLLPQFADEGALLLGFTGLQPPQRLTLLFQMAASGGSARGGDPAPVCFDYLARDDWRPIEPAAIIMDGTNGLENSGILVLDLPAHVASGSTVLTADRQWLRATVKRGAVSYPDAIGIYPNATAARWQDVQGGGAALAKPLPPQTISSSVQPLPDIDTIDQPMESSGGRPPEDRREFEMRLGERLRHKDRADLGWDYERLVLARFPTVWKVAALPARSPQHGDAPGNVLIVVVAGPDSLDVADPTVPSASGMMLGAIREYLAGLSSPFVHLHVVNPIYVRITVHARVQFTEAADSGASLARLNDELTRYLSPWFYDAARAAKGGRYADKDEIEAFLETRPGVDGIWGFEVTYDPPLDQLDWYFLTSATKHDIVAADIAAIAAQGAPAAPARL